MQRHFVRGDAKTETSHAEMFKAYTFLRNNFCAETFYAVTFCKEFQTAKQWNIIIIIIIIKLGPLLTRHGCSLVRPVNYFLNSWKGSNYRDAAKIQSLIYCQAKKSIQDKLRMLLKSKCIYSLVRLGFVAESGGPIIRYFSATLSQN